MLRYLLDTNICIYIKNHRPDEVLARFTKLPPGKVAGLKIIRNQKPAQLQVTIGKRPKMRQSE